MLTTTTIHGRTVLAALALTLAGWEPYPVYSYGKDSSTISACTGSCATSWPPVLTSGLGGVSAGLSQSSAGSVRRGDGTSQLSYKGKPLYFFSLEQVTPTGNSFTLAGNGNGLRVGGGAFRLVTP
jgi:predicted lipoprotein with Yx(FWY)xxD motif